MSSTSLMYHGFGIREYHYIRTTYKNGSIYFTVIRKPFTLRCPCCNDKNVIRRGSVERWFHSLPLGKKKTFIIAHIPRVECNHCQITRQIHIGFSDSRVTYTKALKRYVLELSKFMTIKDVALLLGLSWDTVKSIQKQNLKKRFKKPKLKGLKSIAIDEINIGKGRYLTVALDLKTGAIVFVGDGKGSDALEPFWRSVKRKRSVKIKAVAIDMSPAYIKAVTENLPKAKMVFDHFHVVKLFNEKLSNFRRMLYNKTPDILSRSVLKGTRWLLLTGHEKLAETQDKMDRLEKALLLNKPLATVYYMKEDLRQLWNWADKDAASWHLNSWLAMARSSGVNMLKKFANTLEKHRDGILAYYDCRISTGPLEGTNNKIKTMKRQAYGFRDIEFFKLKIMAIHEAKYALVG